MFTRRNSTWIVPIISLCGLIRRSYTLTTNSNASGSSDIGGIYRIGKGKGYVLYVSKASQMLIRYA